MNIVPPSLRRIAVIAVIASLGVQGVSVAATNDYWNGTSGGNGTWDAVSNAWATPTAGTTPLTTYTNSGGATTAVFGGTAGVVTIASGTTINANQLNFTTAGYTIAGTNGTSFLNLDGTAPGVTSSVNATISAIITGSSGLAASLGSSTATLTLSGANTFTGGFSVDTGAVSTATITDSGAVSGIGEGSSITLSNGGALVYSGTTIASSNRSLTLGAGGGTLSDVGTKQVSYTNTAAVTLTGSGSRTLTLNSSVAALSVFAGELDDAGGSPTSLSETGATTGQWSVTNANSSFTGGVSVAGRLYFTSVADTGVTSSLGAGGAIAINSGAGLYYNPSPAANASTNRQLTLSGGQDTVDLNVAATSLTFSGLATGSGNLYATAGSGSSSTLTLSGTSNSYTGVTTIGNGNIILAVTNLANGGANSSIGKASSAATNLVFASNGTGVLRYIGSSNSTTDRLFSIGNSSVASNATLDASGAGTIQFTNAGALTIGALAGNRTLTLTGTNTGLNLLQPIVGNNATSGVTNLVKSGVGTWELGGVNTYSGSTTIANGNLVVLGSIASGSAVALGNNTATTAILSGTGTISGSLTTSTAGSDLAYIAPGVNTSGTRGDVGVAGTLHVGNLGFTIGGGTNLDYDLAATAAGTSDLITMTGGTLTFGGTTTINVNDLGASLQAGAAYTLISGAASVSGFNASNFSTNGLAAGWTASYNTVLLGVNDYALEVTFSGSESTNYYFTGASSNSFGSAGNYADAATGGNVHTTNPGSTSDVFIAANSPSNLPPDLGSGNTEIHSLTFTNSGAASSVNSSGGGVLTVDAGGITDAATTGNSTATLNAPVTLGADQTWTVNTASNTLKDTGGISGSGKSLTLAGPGSFNFTSGSSSYANTTVNTGAKLFINNTTGTSALGTGILTVQKGATFGGIGNASGLASFAIGSGGTGTAQVQVGNGADATSSLTLAATGASTIASANLTFNLDSASHNANLLDLGATNVTFSSTTLTLNLLGTNVVGPYTPYTLITDSAGFSNPLSHGLTTQNELINGTTYTVITGGLTIASNTYFGTPGGNGLTTGAYANSFLYIDGNNIDVMVVPEPGTWALMLGGLTMLLLWQRQRRRD